MKTIIISIFLIILLQNCGFKLVEQDKLINFHISEIETNGERRINYNLKNRLLFTSKKNQGDSIKITITTKKNKNISEKNIKNEITKYLINITATVEYEYVNKLVKDSFSITQGGNYSVSSQNFLTINSEKKLVNDLTKLLSDQIIEELVLRSNDR
jgi:hypothetical protein